VFFLRILTGVILAGITLQVPAGATSRLHERLLVVFNSNEAESESLANHYARLRSIPREHVVGLPTSSLETISRDEFNRTLRQPLLDLLKKNNWTPRIARTLAYAGGTLEVQQANGNQIWAIALMRGIPLRIEEDATIPVPPEVSTPLRVNQAAVDSELALLTFDKYPLHGLIPNPYYSEERSREFTAYHADQLIMVARLDGPSYADARRLVDDAVATENLELAGRAFFDARGLTDPASGYTIGDEWIRQAEALVRGSGFSTQLDNADPLFTENLPWQDVALYAGWYTGNVTGPFLQPDFRFARGAVAYHIHSFSAETIRNADRNWVGPLIAKGAAATMGSVYEPYLRMTPNIPVFFRSLLDGLTFAEAAYQSQIGLSWMNTVVGDPLYRPFPRPFLDTLRTAESQRNVSADWVVVRMLHILAAQPGPASDRIATVERASASRLTPVVMEETAAILDSLGADPSKCVLLLRQARLESTSARARVRLGLKEADALARLNQVADSIQVYESLMAQEPQAALAFDVPAAALRTATTHGWTQFPPLLQRHLSPVGAPEPAPR
jgi:uncharacterized protein (TIGR03790 family)